VIIYLINKKKSKDIIYNMNKKQINNVLKSGELINFYDLPVMNEYKSNIDDKEYQENVGMVMGEHSIFCGKTKSGKSLAFLNYLYICQNLLSKPFYNKIYMLVKKKEPITEMIKTKLGDDYVEIHYDINSFPSVDTFADNSKTNKNKYLVVIDDYVNDKRGVALKKIQDYFTYGRNKNINILFLSQSYYQTDIFIRKQCAWVCLCGISGENDLKNILRDFKSRNVDINTLENMYKFCKNVPKGQPSFLKIYTQQCNEDERFFKNFIIQLDPTVN